MVQHLADIRSLKAVTSMRMISTKKCLKTRQPLAPYCLFKCSDEIQPTQLMLWIPVMNSSHLSRPSPCAWPASIFCHLVFSILCHVFSQLVFLHVSLYVVPPSLFSVELCSLCPKLPGLAICTDAVNSSNILIAEYHEVGAQKAWSDTDTWY